MPDFALDQAVVEAVVAAVLVGQLVLKPACPTGGRQLDHFGGGTHSARVQADKDLGTTGHNNTLHMAAGLVHEHRRTGDSHGETNRVADRIEIVGCAGVQQHGEAVQRSSVTGVNGLFGSVLIFSLV